MRRPPTLLGIGALCGVLLLVASAGAAPRAGALLEKQRERVAAATVTVPAKSCAGFVAMDHSLVVTAAHCVPDGASRLDVVLRDGQRIASELRVLDQQADLALLALERPASVIPLELSLRDVLAGERVLFVGRVDRPIRAQLARVERRGRCPSLPDVPDAIFTTLSARPGDSGAPIVDPSLEVVGVIHGGAACHIAAPTRDLARQLSSGELARAGERSPADGASVLRLAVEAVRPRAAVADHAAPELAGRVFALLPELLARP